MPPRTDITEDLLFASVRELGELIRAKKLSPVALAEAYLDRLEKIGPKLGAIITVLRESALKEAKEAEKEIEAGRYLGPLHGIPYGVKDLIAAKGAPTTWGAQPYRNQVFDYDAAVIRRLRKAGAILLGKLAMVELAGCFGYNNADASFTGPGRNPWNTDYWSGGSSTGPGAATASGLVAFSIGSETSGSIITPSAYCGVSGLRPTFGRVSRHGTMALSWTLDKLGPMCRSADDCGLILAAIAGKDPLDPSTVDKTFSNLPNREEEPRRRDGKKYKVGVIKGATEGVMPEVRKNFEESIRVLRTFADVEEDVAFPDMPFGEVVGTIVRAEGASAFQDLIESGRSRELRAANDQWGGYAASMVLAVDYLRAMRIRGPMKKALDELYSRYDALVSPSRATVASPIEVDFDRAYPAFGNSGPQVISAGNAAGQPALSVPNGFGIKNLPTGIQFTARAWEEGNLIAIARAYQKSTDWHKRQPPKIN